MASTLVLDVCGVNDLMEIGVRCGEELFGCRADDRVFFLMRRVVRGLEDCGGDLSRWVGWILH